MLENPTLLTVLDARRESAGDGLPFWSIRINYLGATMTFTDRFGDWRTVDLREGESFQPEPWVERVLNDVVIEAVS